MVQVSGVRISPRASGLLSTQSDHEPASTPQRARIPMQVFHIIAGPGLVPTTAVWESTMTSLAGCPASSLNSTLKPKAPTATAAEATGRRSPRPTRRHRESSRRCSGQQSNDQPQDQPQQDEPEHAHTKPSERIFQRRTFCRYLCFLGGLSVNYSRTGMGALLELALVVPHRPASRDPISNPRRS